MQFSEAIVIPSFSAQVVELRHENQKADMYIHGHGCICIYICIYVCTSMYKHVYINFFHDINKYILYAIPIVF